MDPLTRWNQLRWNQLNELEDLRQSLRGLLSPSLIHWTRQNLKPPQWIPLVTVRQTARAYVLKAQLPQVKAEDVQVRIADGMLIITGDRKFERNHKKADRAQYAYGQFVHSFALPPDARPAKVSTLLKQGVLVVRLARNDLANKNPGHVENENATIAAQPPSRRNENCPALI